MVKKQDKTVFETSSLFSVPKIDGQNWVCLIFRLGSHISLQPCFTICRELARLDQELS